MAGMERKRLKEDKLRTKNWKRWGPYLSERQWGTVREDYSVDGNCWDYLTHDASRSRAYRWGEDGLLGITDRQCRLCLSLALWNTKDSILKERLFGVTGHEGNHGEDVKELYYYLDSTPTHSYMKALYKYPQSEFPYKALIEENQNRGVGDAEFELVDTGVFEDKKYFDVLAEYCKNSPNDILGRYTVSNRGPDTATIHILPTLWFRNVWSWGDQCDAALETDPMLQLVTPGTVNCDHPSLCAVNSRPRLNSLGKYAFEEPMAEDGSVASSSHMDSLNGLRSRSPPTPTGHGETGFFGTQKFVWKVSDCAKGVYPEMMFTENETNLDRLYGVKNTSRYVKDAFHDYIVKGKKAAINPKKYGTKCAAHYIVKLEPGQETVIKVRLFQSNEGPPPNATFEPSEFDRVFEQRKLEADMFYDETIPNRGKAEKLIARQAYAGLLWTKQFYYYVVKEWLRGDSTQPQPPDCRKHGRNSDWKHLFNRDIMSVPDKWEYPWYASWDLAFHMIPMANIDIQFAKSQLILLMREWFMHPNGQIPAYEFCFEDVNPPVHAYAVLKVYKASGLKGKRDLSFLARCFHKLVLNFTWWINRKDVEGKNIFSGGFLGLDNIGVFDRSKPLPTGGSLDQADATGWMAFFCTIMLEISLILARRDFIYQDMASKFFEHFVAIVDSMNNVDGVGLWDETDGFYYDYVRNNGHSQPLKIKSMVGLVPLFCTLMLKESEMKLYPGFHTRTKWFLQNKKELAKNILRVPYNYKGTKQEAMLLTVLQKEKLVKLLEHILDEDKFLSPYGVRSLSKEHKDNPFVLHAGNTSYSVKYEPGESQSKLFGGNSNWRGPIWLPMNYLLIENLQRFDYFYGETLKVECPTRSGNYMRLSEVATELSSRLINLFRPDLRGFRPCHGEELMYARDPHFKHLCLFYEYFNGDNGRGCGASHQTGWTALVVNLLKTLRDERSEESADDSAED